MDYMKTNMLFKELGFTLEVKELDDEYVHLEGLASTFGNLDRHNDMVQRGCFTKSLKKRMPKLLNQHNQWEPIGVIDEAYEVEEGLFIKARMPKENSMVKDLAPLLKMGAINDFSIGYSVNKEEMTKEGSRLLQEVDLWEVSIVTFPANEKARITAVKSGILGLDDVENIQTKREFEQMLMDTGSFSRKACVTLAARFNENQRDSVKKNEEIGQRDSVNASQLRNAFDELKKTLTNGELKNV